MFDNIYLFLTMFLKQVCKRFALVRPNYCPAINVRTISTVNETDLQVFEQILGSTGVKTEDLDGYNTDWLRMHKGKIYESIAIYEH